MRVVGLLLVSALMVIPVASAQQLSKSFKGTRNLASMIGSIGALTGVISSFYFDLAPGALIVVLIIAIFILSIVLASILRRREVRKQIR
jgi:zinc transport system permease protein